MQMRALGRSGLSVPVVVFGGNVFGWTADQAMSFRLLDACLERGLIAMQQGWIRWQDRRAGREIAE